MKRVIKKVLIITLILFVVLSIYKYSFGTYNASKLLKSMDKDSAGKASKVVKTADNVMQNIVVIARIVGVAVAVGMLIVLGMKYMTAAPSEKADIKKSAVVYVFGALLLFGVVGVLGIVANFSKVVTETA